MIRFLAMAVFGLIMSGCVMGMPTGPVARMACPPDSLDRSFTRDLWRVASFFTEDGNLYLELPYDSGTMKFRLTP